MAHRLAFVAFTGIAVSVVCLGAAAALGAHDVPGMDLSFLGGLPACDRVANATATSRDLDWDGSDHAGLSVPGQAVYTPGIGTRLHVAGDPQILAHLRVREGNIEMDCNSWIGRSDDLKITLPGRDFRRFSVSGSGDLALHKLAQDRLKVSVSGSGSIKADGKVEETDLHISGSGDVDFRQVAGRIAQVHISGSGNSDIAPSDEADVHVSGSGDVNLHSNPAQVRSHISGSGAVHSLGSGT